MIPAMPEQSPPETPDDVPTADDVDVEFENSEVSAPTRIDPDMAVGLQAVLAEVRASAAARSAAEPVPAVSAQPAPEAAPVAAAAEPAAPVASEPAQAAAPAPAPAAPVAETPEAEPAAHVPRPATSTTSSNSGLRRAQYTNPQAAPVELGVIGRYRLQQQLAVGGMAQLYLAAIEGPDGFSKPCVVKTILPEFATLTDFTEMFINEARVTAMLHHPNIVEIYDFGREGNRYFIAMEYVPGASLQQLLKYTARSGKPLGARFALSIGLQMCEALAYAQNLRAPDGRPLKLVHRDLSTGNILVSSAGLAKLSDFGIVKSDINLNATATGVVKGKYPYMSPEQIRNEPLDSRSDIFSLSTVLFEVATGIALFKRKGLAETINAVATAEVRKPSELVPGFPPMLEQILLKGLSLYKEDRYQNFDEMAEALERFRSSGSWSSSPREIANIVQGLVPGGVAPGAYSSTGSSIGSNADSSASEANMPPRPPSWGVMELGLIVVVLALILGVVMVLTS